METKNQSLESVINHWISKQPAWYSAALHVALQGELTPALIDALAVAACKESGIDPGIGSNITLTDYTKADLGSAGASLREVILESITAVSGINAISPDSRLSLAPSGITIVYGNNGSGKSGFSRIIRNACTSRSGSIEILSNVFEDNGKPSATFDARIDGAATRFSWKEGESPYPTFPEIAFFDSTCAAMEIEGKDNTILYVPEVVSSILRLPQIITAVATRIQQCENQLTDKLDTRTLPPDIRNSPKVAALLSCQSESEAIKLVDAALLNQQEEIRRATLPQLIATDPSTEIPKLDRRLAQIKGMRSRLVDLYQCCQKSFIQVYAKALDEFKQAEEAAKAASELASGSSLLEGFGGGVWKTLWEAAREYSDYFAYKGNAFPHLAQGSPCPLCQQPLSIEAISRLATFETYVNGIAEKNLTEKKRELGAIAIRFANAAAAVKSDRAGIGILSTDLARSGMDELIQWLAPIANVPDDNSLAQISELTQVAGTYVRAEIDELEKSLVTLRESQQSGSVENLKAELASLNSSAWIFANRDLLISDSARRELSLGLESVRRKINTRTITALVSTVSKVEVVERMQVAFAGEMKRLNAFGKQVAISTHARAGQEYQRITLEGANASTRQVLSEGEQKIVALAGFFALLDVIPGKSSVILDDPITSLDHLWRAAVAKRIVEEAKTRPVTIFTHEPMFCNAISELSTQQDVPVAYRTVQRRGATTGIVSEGLDWHACNVKQRISALRNTASTLRRRYNAGEFETDAALGKELCICYSDLRSTWERAVESVLLAGVVKRAERPIHTQQLRALSDITDEDIRIVDENMAKCSLLTNAHDDPFTTPDSFPSIQEFEADVKVLDQWRKMVETRRQQARKH